MLLLGAIILTLYITILYLLFEEFSKIPSKLNLLQITKEERISIIVAFKDEEKTLGDLIHSISKLDYTNFEVIFIDDHSSDSSILTIENRNIEFDYKILKSKGVGKKEALTLGVKNSSSTILAFTDADCRVPILWLKGINQLAKKSDLILLPINFYSTNILKIESYQQLDLIALMGFTFGTLGRNNPVLSNGANWAIKKELYDYNTKKHISSGDDVFQLQSAKEKGLKIWGSTDERLTVLTAPEKNYKDLLAQRARWFSKSKYLDVYTKLNQNIVGLTNLFIILLLFFSSFSLLVNYLLVKFIIDILWLYTINKKLKRDLQWHLFPVLFIAYPFYLILVLVKSYKPIYWKGRKIKN